MSYKPEVKTVNHPTNWYGNSLRFATRAEAEANAADLMGRWFIVTDTRAVESTDPVNYVWTDEGLITLEEQARREREGEAPSASEASFWAGPR